MRLPGSLFGRTAAVLLIVFIGVQAVALGLAWFLVIVPMSTRTADDLAARMLLVAQTWVELPPDTRTDYEIELSLKHGLELGAVATRLPALAPASQFGDLLADSLSRRAGQAMVLKRGPDPAWTWVELDLAGNQLRIGFEMAPYEPKALLVAGAAFLMGALITLLTALLLVRQTSLRLRRLGHSAAEVGEGRSPARLPEDGPDELRDLTIAFNRMADSVQSLLENRTVLLAGISHDLRTPLTRLRLALSMLDGADPARVRRMETDLEEMNRLVGEMMDFVRALNVGEAIAFELQPVLVELIQVAAAEGPVQFSGNAACRVPGGERALRRILANLLANARRYGGEGQIDVDCQVQGGQVRIQVMDRGPGIPATQREAVFRPFVRLEASRARDTGGSGLGLTIARQLADAYGWRIELKDRDGGGLRADLVLPASREGR